MNLYGEASGPEHKLFGRIAPITEALYRAVSRVINRPLNPPELCGAMPDWCHNIADKLVLTILKRLTELAPQGKFEARNVGRIMGVVLRGLVHLYKEIPAQLKQEGLLDLSPEKEKKVDALIDTTAIFSFASEKLRKPISTEDELLAAGTAGVKKAAELQTVAWLAIGRYLLDRTIAEQHEFLCGIPEGFTLFLNNDGEYSGQRKRTELYILLLAFWPEISEMQKAEPPRTCKFLLDWLEENEDEPLVEDPKQFYALCGEIGLVMGPPGHPHKSAPPNY